MPGRESRYISCSMAWDAAARQKGLQCAILYLWYQREVSARLPHPQPIPDCRSHSSHRWLTKTLMKTINIKGSTVLWNGLMCGIKYNAITKQQWIISKTITVQHRRFVVRVHSVGDCVVCRLEEFDCRRSMTVARSNTCTSSTPTPSHTSF